MQSLPCARCGSKCCKYVALPIDTPSCAGDIDHIRWYLHHKNVNVFIDNDNIWHVEFVTTCDSLGKDGRCSVYETRPDICRNYGSNRDTDECEFYSSPYRECFTTVDDFERWASRDRVIRKLV
jgi:Fe-S-cluster containining protein